MPRLRPLLRVPFIRVGPSIHFLLIASLLSLTGPVRANAGEVAPPPRPIRVGVLTDNYPFSFVDDGGPPKGYAVDLLAAIEATMGIRFERVVGTTDEINPAFESGRLDMLQSYVPNAERERFADFSEPYLELAGSIFARRGTTGIRTLEDLHGLRVMVHADSMGETLLRKAGLAGTIVHVDSVEQAFRLLDAGTHDATLASRLTGLTTVKRLGLKNVIAVGEPVPGYNVNYCFAVRNGDATTLRYLREGRETLERNGQWAIIHDRWFSDVGPKRFTVLEIAIATSASLTIALVVAVLAAVHQRRLRRRISRQAEALRTSEARYRGVFESTRDGLLVLQAPSGNDAGWQLSQINPAARTMLGEPAGPALPAGLRHAYPGDGALWDHIEAALRSRDESPFEFDRSSDSASAWVRVAITPLEDGRWLVVLGDLTEARLAAERLRQSEAQLRQTQKLEAIGTLASGIAHDFNNILTAMIGNVELVRLDLPPEHPATDALGEIIHATERARFLVRQILTFSRRADSRREVVDLGPIIKETLRFVSATAPSTITIRHTRQDNLPPIEIDPTQLHQVVMNLCTNAVHAMRGKQGLLEISERAIRIPDPANDHPSTLNPGSYLQLTVRDSGIGMTPEVLQRVFEPFFTTKPPGEGTGLGLAVVHGIVQSCGGTIAVSSALAKGTAFHLYFPASHRVASKQSIEVEGTPGGHGEHILFVDDEPAIVHAARKLLERLGYTVAAFSRAEEALAEFKRRRGEFAVVITDLTMPHMSGIELATRVREDEPHVPVILASGFIGERELALARSAQIEQIVDKPLSLTVLGSAVAACLRQRHD